MLNIKEIDIEYKSGVLFGTIALILSFFTSLMAGNEIGLVVTRSMIFAFAFSILGYVNVYILKKYVPEIYELMNSIKSIKQSEDISLSPEQEEKGDELPIHNKVDSEPMEPKKSDLGDNYDFEDKSTSIEESSVIHSDSYLDIGEVDKHGEQIRKEEKYIRYEPKIIAKAVRTMMKRDED